MVVNISGSGVSDLAAMDFDGRILELSLEICPNFSCSRSRSRKNGGERPSMACHSWDLLDKYRAIAGEAQWEGKVRHP